jgi:hypothetical protein
MSYTTSMICHTKNTLMPRDNLPKGRKSLRHFAPRVLTKYGGRIWVKRKFEAKELLAAADVPEKLAHL